MSRKIATLACALMLAACAPAPQRPAPAPSAPAPQPPAPGAEANAYEQRVVRDTNAFRAENKLAPLQADALLSRIAQAHAANMARQDRFGDTDKNGHVLDGKNVEYRIKTGGYQYARVAENVGYQFNRADPVASMMDGWKTSPGHRRNLLLGDVTQTGVGVARGKSGRWYFVQLFGRPQDAGAVKTSN